MSTNYFLHPRGPCECCGRPFPRQHIGKSSVGWVFNLHVDAEHTSLDDWVAAWSQPDAVIVDEYGRPVTGDDMLAIITERSGSGRFDEAFHRHNHSVDGPNGLARSKVDGRHCVGYGDGTWDLIAGEFS